MFIVQTIQFSERDFVKVKSKQKIFQYMPRTERPLMVENGGGRDGQVYTIIYGISLFERSVFVFHIESPCKL